MGEECNILIAGDWFVDEYWFLARHYSDIASHTGPDYYRTFSTPHEHVRDLCGAGFLARLLFQLRKKSKVEHKYHIYGIGNWNELDTKYIYHLVHTKVKEWAERYAAMASFSITPEFCGDKIEDIKIVLRTLKPLYPTIRIIRQFQLEGNRFEQIN